MRRFFALARHLTVRLPNHLGDACMALPALELLAHEGFDLCLAGRPWGDSLFGAYEWPYVALRDSSSDNVTVLRAARSGRDATGLLLTNSFSTAFEFRRAGYASTGYARGARSWLLNRALPVHPRDHMVEYYYRLAATEVRDAPAVPHELSLRLSDSMRARARAMLQEARITGSFVVLCPVAIGTHRGRDKAWSEFTRLATALAARGVRVVAMPGPGESAALRAVLPDATVLPESEVALFAALLAASKAVVANDSGAGHLAAAVGARLISVFGVTELEHTRPWGSRVTIVGSSAGWPRYEEVEAAVAGALAD